ncbi:MAG TPA: XdhC family protein [Bryobacteraceae bacterium]|nr:XdhC family protein [Bryobacteraceae bacterium]
MTQLEQILELWKQARSAGEAAVLATVVKTQGSSYRLPGARLLITASGQRAGSISGGCLEDDLVKKAWWLTEKGPMVRRYDTTPDGEIGPSFGLGCNGIIHVLLQRLDPRARSVLDLLREVRESRRPAAVAHILQPRELVGEAIDLDTHGEVASHISDTRVAVWLRQQAGLALQENRSRAVVDEGGLEAFCEVLAPPIQLLIFGAGDDAVPVVEMANYFGWRVSVLDGRAHYARRERFPSADEVLVRPAGESGVQAVIDPWTAAVLMTHSYSQDLEIVRELSAMPLAYVGILGPRKRTSQLLAEAGVSPSSIGPALHGPMGLDIGADGPEQVALAIVAEIQAAFNGRPGGFLRERAGSIHSEEKGSDETATNWMPSIACVT